jgi:hypothetical protein
LSIPAFIIIVFQNAIIGLKNPLRAALTVLDFWIVITHFGSSKKEMGISISNRLLDFCAAHYVGLRKGKAKSNSLLYL